MRVSTGVDEKLSGLTTELFDGSDTQPLKIRPVT